MKDYLVDSNVIIAYFRRNEHKHDQAKELLLRIGSFFITEYVLSEVATVLRLKEAKATVSEAINMLMWNENIKIIRLDKEEFEGTANVFLSSKKKISFVDASLIVLSSKRKYELVTFDKDLVKSLI